MISEKIELLGKNVYKDIPGELTLKAMPTVNELDYVSSEDFEQTMLENILPKCVEEKVDFYKLLNIDFYWICRCLRLLTFGPYFTTPRILCPDCGTISGEYQVNLKGVNCVPLPEDFTNDIVIPKSEFVDFQGDVHLKLLTVQDRINLKKDKMFMKGNKQNTEYANLCYSITSIGKEKDVTPVSVKVFIEKELSRADYIILLDKFHESADFGLRAGGSTKCPICGNTHAAFVALVDDRFLRPSVGDIKAGRNDRSARDA